MAEGGVMVEDTALPLVVAEDGGGVFVIPSLLLLQRRVGYPSWCSRGGLYPTWCCRGGLYIPLDVAEEGCIPLGVAEVGC